MESTLAAVICPNCDQVSTKVHDLSAVQMVRDLSIGERRCYLNYQAWRFDCQQCHKTFVERVDWKRPGVSYTLRYEKYIYQRARKEPVSQIAQDEGLSEDAVQAIFEQRAHLPWRAVPGKKRLRHGGTRKSR